MPQEGVTRIKIEAIQQNQFQPRQRFDQAKIQQLADSIHESGLIYPLLVRKAYKSGVDQPEYELIAGERRLRALKLLGQTDVPAIIKESSNEQALELALIENLQREELNPIEEAHAFERLQGEFSLTQEQIASKAGKDRATVTNTLRLLKLSPAVQSLVAEGALSLGHARALLGLGSEKAQRQLAEKISKQGLSVRQVEQLVKKATLGTGKSRQSKTRDPHLASAEEKLQRALGTQVKIHHKKSRGWVQIAYFSLKDLDRLMGKLTRSSK